MSDTVALSGRKEASAREDIRADNRIAGLYFTANTALYVISLVVAVSDLPAAWRLIGALFHGVALASFFIIGHDCVHNAFFETRRQNQFLGRFAYGFCWHSISLWKLVHNINHHGRTNLKGTDDVWAPFSPAEFKALPFWRRLTERAYRGPLGHLIYYQTQYLLPKLILPVHRLSRPHWRQHIRESLFVIGFGLFLTVATVSLALAFHGTEGLVMSLVYGALIPFIFWNTLTSFTIYVQHTNQKVHWFASEEQWSHHNGQIRGTVDTIMPVRLAPLYSEVMRHTAHHDNPTIPVYRLPKIQDRLNRTHRSDITSDRFNWRTYFDNMRRCKLYDFEKRCWTDFDGVPTSLTYEERFAAPENPFTPEINTAPGKTEAA